MLGIVAVYCDPDMYHLAPPVVTMAIGVHSRQIPNVTPSVEIHLGHSLAGEFVTALGEVETRVSIQSQKHFLNIFV